MKSSGFAAMATGLIVYALMVYLFFLPDTRNLQLAYAVLVILAGLGYLIWVARHYDRSTLIERHRIQRRALFLAAIMAIVQFFVMRSFSYVWMHIVAFLYVVVWLTFVFTYPGEQAEANEEKGGGLPTDG